MVEDRLEHIVDGQLLCAFLIFAVWLHTAAVSLVGGATVPQLFPTGQMKGAGEVE